MTESSDCSVAGGTVYIVTGGAVNSGARVTACFVSGGAEGLVAGALSILRAYPWLLSLHIAIPIFFMLSSFLQIGQCSPHEQPSAACPRSHHCMGDHCYLGQCFCFDGGSRCGDWSRGNQPIFPGLK